MIVKFELIRYERGSWDTRVIDQEGHEVKGWSQTRLGPAVSDLFRALVVTEAEEGEGPVNPEVYEPITADSDVPLES